MQEKGETLIDSGMIDIDYDPSAVVHNSDTNNDEEMPLQMGRREQ